MTNYQAGLIARRVPRNEVVLGRAYVIHARNGGVGVAVLDGRRRSELGYRLHRVKFGSHFLDTEIDWEDDENFGTAIPLRLLPDVPPTDDAELLDWLAAREVEAKAEITAAWDEVLAKRVTS